MRDQTFNFGPFEFIPSKRLLLERDRPMYVRHLVLTMFESQFEMCLMFPQQVRREKNRDHDGRQLDAKHSVSAANVSVNSNKRSH
jgi:hypothetical protein